MLGLRSSAAPARSAIESATTNLQLMLASEREGQLNDRYTKAIEQLGSGKVDVRLGGIYTLERLARDSARDNPTAMEVLSTFVRYRAQYGDGRVTPTGGDLARPKDGACCRIDS